MRHHRRRADEGCAHAGEMLDHGDGQPLAGRVLRRDPQRATQHLPGEMRRLRGHVEGIGPAEEALRRRLRGGIVQVLRGDVDTGQGEQAFSVNRVSLPDRVEEGIEFACRQPLRLVAGVEQPCPFGIEPGGAGH